MTGISSHEPSRLPRVLVIDDEALIRLLCRVNLEAHGIEVLEGEDGVAGLEIARTAQPDIVLLDVMMPGLDGWRTFEALRADERTRALPVIFLTARADLRDRMRGMEMGAIDYVTKPFNPDQLPAFVKDVFARLQRREGEEMRRERMAELQRLAGDS